MADPVSYDVPRGLKLAGAVLLIILLALVIGDRALALRHWEPPAPTGDLITVSGQGKVSATPDVGLVAVAVESRGATPADVLADNAAKMQQIQDFMKAQGIEPKDLRTQNFNLYPNQTYNPQTGRQSIDGYVLTQSLEVKVRDLAKVGVVLSGAIDRGANQVGQLSFTIDDPEQLRQQARVDAIAQARAQATELAAAAGVKLGRLRTFSEGGDGWNPPMPMYAYDRAESVSVEPGSQEIRASVVMGFEILH